MDLLVVEAAQAGSVEAETSGLRANIGREVKGAVGVEIRVAVKAGHTVALLGNLAVLGLVEFFLRKRSEKKPQAFHLDRRDNAVHDFIEIADGEQLTARHISEFGTCGEENRRRKLRGDVVRKVEVDIEAPEIASFLAPNFVNLPIREDLASRRLLDMR